MSESRVQFFVKFFTEETHAEQFLDGLFYMRKLKYFQKLEAAAMNDGRPDANEGIVAWHQPDRVSIVIEVPGVGKIELGPDDLAAPVSIARDVFSEYHVFCMTALSLPDPSSLLGDQEEVREQLQNALQFDQRCLKFGPHAVLVKVAPFVKQLRHALENCGHRYRAEKVEYYDPKDFHGEFTDDEAPFRKQIEFQYQQEYRICVLADDQNDDPMTLDIGKIGDFAVKVRSADINGSLRVNIRHSETPKPS